MADWNQLYASDDVVPDEPHPLVVRALGDVSSGDFPRVVDVGCGAGRHLAWLSERGHHCVGLELAPRGLQRSKARLSAAGRKPLLVAGDMRSLPFAPGFADAVIAIDVVYHGTTEEVTRTVAELVRLLRPGGLCVFTLLSTRTWKYGEGARVDARSFVQERGPESGVVHHFADEARVRELTSGMEVRSAVLDEFVDDLGRHSHWWIVAAREHGAALPGLTVTRPK